MKYVCTGAILRCTHGTNTSELHATPKRVSLQGKDQANIADFVSMKNVPGFGRCRSLMYPPTAAATAANHGRLTPMPCVPGTCPKWQAIDPNSLLGGEPALLQPATLRCVYGGTISIVNSGQTKESKIQSVNLALLKEKLEKPEEIDIEDFDEKVCENLEPDSVLDGIQMALDAAGFIPLFGAIPDLTNAAISACRGRWLEAGMSLVAAVPGIGDVAGGAKLVYKGAKIAQKSGKAQKVVTKVARSDSSKLSSKPIPARNVVTGKNAPASGVRGSLSYAPSSPKKSETSSFTATKRRTKNVSSNSSGNVQKPYKSQSGAVTNSRRAESVGNSVTLKGTVTKSQYRTPQPNSVLRSEKMSSSYNNVGKQELRNVRARRLGVTPEEMQKGGSHILYDKTPSKISSDVVGKKSDNQSFGQLSRMEKEKPFNREEYLNRTDCYYDDEVKSIQEIHKSFQPHRTPVTIKDKELSSPSNVSTNSSISHDNLQGGSTSVGKGQTHSDAVPIQHDAQKSVGVQPSKESRFGSLTINEKLRRPTSNGKGDFSENIDKRLGSDDVKIVKKSSLENPSNSPLGSSKLQKDSKASSDSKVISDFKSEQAVDRYKESQNLNKLEKKHNLDLNV